MADSLIWISETLAAPSARRQAAITISNILRSEFINDILPSAALISILAVPEERPGRGRLKPEEAQEIVDCFS